MAEWILLLDESCVVSSSSPVSEGTLTAAGITGAHWFGSAGTYTIVLDGNVPTAQSQAVVIGSDDRYKAPIIQGPNCAAIVPAPDCDINVQSTETVTCVDGKATFLLASAHAAHSYTWTSASGTLTDASASQTHLEIDVTGCAETVAVTLVVATSAGSESTCTANAVFSHSGTIDIQNVPNDVTVEADDVPSVNTYNVVAADSCFTPTLSFEETTQTVSASTYIITRTWTAADECTTDIVSSQDIVVQDTVPPTITNVPDDQQNVHCHQVPSPCEPFAWDANDGDLLVDYREVINDGSCPNVYTLVRTWTASDAAGNSVVSHQTIGVIDDVPPTLQYVEAHMTVECNQVPAVASVSATDNCDSSVQVTTTTSVEGNNHIRVFSAQDSCGNVATQSQTVTVVDSVAPVMSGVAADITVNCDSVPGAPCEVTARDACDGSMAVTYTQTRLDGSCGDTYQLVRTWTAVDSAGNAATQSRTISVSDTTAPTITQAFEGTRTHQCDTDFTAVPTASDDCAGIVNVTEVVDVLSSVTENQYTKVRTLTATDSCGNVGTATATIVVDDTTPPTLVNLPPSDTTVPCHSLPDESYVAAMDNCECGGTVDLSVTNNEVRQDGSCEDEYTLIRTLATSDCAGNTASFDRTIHVVDTTAPVMTGVPAAVNVSCTSVPDAPTVTADDLCDANMTVELTEVTTNQVCEGAYTLTRTWSVQDNCGNTVSESQVIQVSDSSPPTLHDVPSHENFPCSTFPDVVEGDVTATDTCGNNLTVTWEEVRVNGTCDTEYKMIRTYSTTDGCNPVSAVQTITVNDLVAPVISGVTASEVTIERYETVPSPDPATAEDACDGTVDVDVEDNSEAIGSCGNEVITRTYSTADACGNAPLAIEQKITILDRTAPSFATFPDDVSQDCASSPHEPDVAPTITPSANGDNYTMTHDCALDGASPCTHQYTVVCSYVIVDDCGNDASQDFTRTVSDVTAPVVTAPADVTYECAFDGSPQPDVSANDACENDLSVAFTSFTREDLTLPADPTVLEYFVRSWTVADSCGNSATDVQTVTIVDTIAPTITCPDAPTDLTCHGSVTWGNASQTDACQQAQTTIEYTQSKAGDASCSYTVTREYTATDPSGHTHSCEVAYSLSDELGPVCPSRADETVECTGVDPTISEMTCVDACDGNITEAGTSSTVDFSSGNSHVKVLYYAWTATDNCGNFDSSAQTILVEDTTPPTFDSDPNDVTDTCVAGTAPTITAGDACHGSAGVTVDATDDSVAEPGCLPYSFTRTWTATDASGHTSTVDQAVTVVGDATLSWTAFDEFDREAEWSQGHDDGFDSNPEATSAECDDAVTVTCVVTKVNGTCDNEYTMVNTCTAVSDCASLVGEQRVTYVDTTPDPVTPIANGTLDCLDTVPDVPAGCTESVTSGSIASNCYELTRVCQYSDNCGNTDGFTYKLDISDTTPPTLSVPADETLDCAVPVPAVNYTASDDCSSGDYPATVVTVESDATTSGTRVYVRKAVATDACGLASEDSTTYTFVDTNNPSTCDQYSDVTEEYSGPSISSPWPSDCACIGLTDDCSDVSLACSASEINGTCANERTLTYTFISTDDSGNSASHTYTVVVEDTTPPNFDNVAQFQDATYQIDQITATPPDQMTAKDAYDDAIVTPTYQETQIVHNDTAETHIMWDLVRHWTICDVCNNCAEHVQTVTVLDSVPTSIIGVPANATDVCTATWRSDDEAKQDIQHWADNGTSIDITTDIIEGSCDTEFTVRKVFTTTDPAGNTLSETWDVNVTDNGNPTWKDTYDTSNINIEGCAHDPAPVLQAEDQCVTPVQELAGSQYFVAADVTVELTETNETVVGGYRVLRTWTAADVCGNSISKSQTVTVTDTSAPTVESSPDDMDITDCSVPEVVAPVFADNCSEFTVTFAETSEPGNCTIDTLVRTWVATNEHGSATTHVQRITYSDSTPPTISGIPAHYADDLCLPIDDAPTVTAADQCDVSPSLPAPELTQNADGTEVLYTWTASDSCGNTFSDSLTITRSDSNPPTTDPFDEHVTVECGDVVPAENFTHHDDCTVEGSTTVTTEAGSCDDEYLTIRSRTATDGYNSVNMAQTIHHQDTTAPTLVGVPADTTLADCAHPPADVVTCTDCGACTVTDETTDIDEHTKFHTWTATDACGNTASDVQTVYLIDTTPPTLTCTCDDSTATACGSVSDETYGDAECVCSVQDDCGGTNMTTTVVIEPGTCADNKLLIRTIVGTDRQSNTATHVQTITFVDNTPPAFDPATVPGVTVECDSVPAPDQLTANDDCSGDTTVTLETVVEQHVVPVNGSYLIYNTWSSTDGCGNTDSVVQQVTVEDTTAPSIYGVPDDVSVKCNDTLPTATVTSDDNCDAILDTTEQEVTVDGCPDTTVTTTYTATDDSGNQATDSWVITVVDEVAPVLSGDFADRTDECTATDPATATASDDCDANVDSGVTPVLYSQSSSDQAGAVRVYERTWTIADSCGNTATEVATITVLDTITPVISCTGCADVTVERCSTDHLNPDPVASASDDCHSTVQVIVNKTESVVDSCTSIIVYELSASDGYNTATQSHTVTIIDTAAPTLRGIQSDAELACQSTATPYDVHADGYNSECVMAETLLTPVVTTEAGPCDNERLDIYTWSATDDCGLSVTGSQTLSVKDYDASTVTGDDSTLFVECNAVPTAQVPTASDACGGATVTADADESVPGPCPDSYDLIRHWTATDDCGHTTPFSRTIEVSDSTAPTFVANNCGALQLDCANATIPDCDIQVSDNCVDTPNETFNSTVVTQDSPNDYSTLRTWDFCDNCGNCAQHTQVVTVSDVTNPVVVGPDSITVEYPHIPTQYDGEMTSTDDCSDVNHTCTENMQAGTCPHSFVLERSCSATDPSGNTGEYAYQVHVQDTTPPVIFGVPENMDLEFGEVHDLADALDHVFSTDNSGETVTVTVAQTIEAGNGGQTVQIIYRTFSASDACGNAHSEVQTITILDTVAPVFHDNPVDETVQCDAVPVPCPMATVGEAISVDMNSDTTTPGITIRSWTSTDSYGNSAQHSQTLTVVDTTAPVLSRMPEDVSVACDCEEFPAAPTVVALDNCDQSIVVNFTEVKTIENSADDYTMIRSWAAADASGNSVAHSQTIVVTDATAPQFSPAAGDAEVANANVACDDLSPVVNVKAFDECDSSMSSAPTFTESITNGACDSNYVAVRTWSATDRTGNVASLVQTIEVSDNVAPLVHQVGASCVHPADNQDSVFLLNDILSTHDNCEDDVIISSVTCNSTTVQTGTPECTVAGDNTSITVKAVPGVVYNAILDVCDPCGQCTNFVAAITVPATALEVAVSGATCQV